MAVYCSLRVQSITKSTEKSGIEKGPIILLLKMNSRSVFKSLRIKSEEYIDHLSLGISSQLSC